MSLMQTARRGRRPRATGQRTTGGSVVFDAVVLGYGGRQVTRPLDLSIAPGEVVSIVGSSGCGKTTLLRSVAGLIRAQSGTVSVGGTVVSGAPEGVAMVFQHFGLFPWKTVQSNIAYPLVVRGVRRKEAAERAAELVELVGLQGYERHYPHELSGGMRQRTGLARAVAARPSVLLMDEPFGALDAQTREVLQFEVLEILARERVTTLFVTHSIDEAVLFGHRAVVLKGAPSGVAEVLTIELADRRQRAVLRSPEFLSLREHLWSVVMDQGPIPSSTSAKETS